MADYKALPYKIEKEFYKVGEQNWVILRSNENGKNYVKPDRITLDGSKSIMGFCEGDNTFLLFQANDSLVSSEAKPSLARVAFGSFKEGKWENDDTAQNTWKTTYEDSNKWVALDCDFPILKYLAKWLHTTKLIISDLVYIKLGEVDETKFNKALDSAVKAVVEDTAFEDDKENYAYLQQFGLEAVEFEEKLSKAKSKIPPIEGIKKNENDFITYDKIIFSLPPAAANTGSGYSKGASEGQKAQSRLDFVKGAKDKVKELFALYDNPLELTIALSLSGINIEYKAIASYYSQNVISVTTESKPIQTEVQEIKAETPLPEGDLKELISVHGEAKVNKWLSSLDGLNALGNPINLLTAIAALKDITFSDTFKAEPKNILAWAKNNLKSLANVTCRSILDLPYQELLIVASAVRSTDAKVKNESTFSIVDLPIELVDTAGF